MRRRQRKCSIKLMEQFQKRILSSSIYTRSDDAISLVQQNSNVFNLLFSSFYVFGVYPWSLEPTPQMLYKFPNSAVEEDNSLPNLCFPNQCCFKILRFKDKTEFIKKHIIDDSEITKCKFVPMYFPEDTEDPYMFCTYLNVSPLTIPSFAHDLELDEMIGMVGNDSIKMSMICLAFKTKLPFHELFKDLNIWILRNDLIARFVKSVDIFSSEGVGFDKNKWIQFQEQRDSIKIILNTLYQSKIPIQGNCLIYESEQSLIPSFKWERPLVTDEENHIILATEAMRIFMKFIPKKNFIPIFLNLFLEKKIIVCSVDMQYVCWIILALHFLLRPLYWVCGSVSSLPYILEEYLDSPNPMIFGLTFNTSYFAPENVCIDLTKKKIYTPPCPDPPFKKDFTDSINNLWDKENSHLLILKYCNDYIKKVIGSVQSCIMTNFTDPVHVNSIFMSELFLGHFKPEERDFCNDLKDTQMFTFYVEQECRKKSDQMVFQ